MSETQNQQDAPQQEQQEEPTKAEKTVADLVRRWTLRLLILAALLLVWNLFADRLTPYTEHARVRTYIKPVAPEVSGLISEVHVSFSQRVKAGDILFKIDPEPYQTAVEQAQAELEQVTQSVGASSNTITTAQAQLAQANARHNLNLQQKRRYDELWERRLVARADMDKIAAEVTRSAADIERAEAELQRAREELGSAGEDNPKIRQAFAKLEQANLDLLHTEVRAPTDGGVTNVSISVGQYANTGQPLMTFIDNKQIWVEAFYRENSLGNIKPGDKVEIALDLAPGRIFQGEVISPTYGVQWQRNSNPGELPTVDINEGWLRDTQRFPISIAFTDDESVGSRLEGGQADTLVYTGNNWLLNGLGWIQIRIHTLLSYLR